MVTYRIELAERVIEIRNLFDKTLHQCALFRTEKPAAFHVETTAADIDREREHTFREEAYEGLPHQCYPDEELESTATYRKIADLLLKEGIAVFHGAVVAVGEEAYLFTAKSGTGKTTHVRLWLEHIADSYIVNGDKPLLMVKDGRVYACGSPWAGKEGYFCKQNVPLKALCVLERGTENHIAPLSRKEAFPMLMQQVYRSPSQMPAVMRLMWEIGELVPLYRLGCNMEPEAAFVSYHGMK